jgi:hypothetical protein
MENDDLYMDRNSGYVATLDGFKAMLQEAIDKMEIANDPNITVDKIMKVYKVSGYLKKLTPLEGILHGSG